MWIRPWYAYVDPGERAAYIRITTATTTPSTRTRTIEDALHPHHHVLRNTTFCDAVQLTQRPLTLLHPTSSSPPPTDFGPAGAQVRLFFYRPYRRSDIYPFVHSSEHTSLTGSRRSNHVTTLILPGQSLRLLWYSTSYLLSFSFTETGLIKLLRPIKLEIFY